MTKQINNHPGLKILFRVLFTLTTLAVMVWIFCLSAETAAQSSATSSGLIEKIADTFVEEYKTLPVEEKKAFVASLQDIVRSAAHFAIYGALGLSVAGFAATFKGSFWLKMVLCQLFSSLYALSDEYHQTFSEGRSFQIVDIAFDSAGAFCGIFLVLLVVLIFLKLRQKGKSK